MDIARTCKRLFCVGTFSGLVIMALSVVAESAERIVGVTCSCDPPGTYRPPGFDCRGYCTGGSGGSSSGESFGGSFQPRYPQPTFDTEQQRQEELQRLQREAEEQRRREEEARREFERKKQAALNSLKGMPEGSLTIKGGTPFFGIKGNPPGELQLKTVSPEQARGSILSAWKQLHCAAWISGHALERAKGGNREEVHHLGMQAIQALSGERIDVACDAPDPPRPYGQLQLSPASAVVRFYQALVRAIETQAERVEQAERLIQEATAKGQAVQQEIAKRKEEIAWLKAEIKTDPSGSSVGGQGTERNQAAGKKAKSEARGKKTQEDDFLREAREARKRGEEALKEAQHTEADVRRMLETATRQKKTAQAKISQYQRLSERVQANPDLAASAVTQIGR